MRHRSCIMIDPRAGSRKITMTTVSKYGAVDAEAQSAAAPEEKPLGRAKVALICVAAALSGAAVASVARVRTRTYVADLFGVGYTMGGKPLEPPPATLKKPCYLDDIQHKCSETETCYGKPKVLDDGTTVTKYKCAAEGSLGSKWINIDVIESKKKKPSVDPLSGGGPCSSFKGMDMCAAVHDPHCDENGKELGSSKCSFCTSSKGQAYRGTIKRC